jgi:acyl-CoA synthetase (AMP-forming)/AMP-acid ligase II
VLFELIARAPAEHPLVIGPRGELTYGEALRRGRAVAHGLRDAGIERFGIAVADTRDVVVALAGAAALGVEACVYPRDLEADGWSRLAARFDHAVVLTDEDATLDHGRAVTLRSLEGPDRGELPAPESSPVLILTTGTTGDQKGARHDWSRLMAAVRHPDERSDARWLLAYNPNQFAGLQVILHVIVSGTTAVQPASRRPADVIAALRDHRVTHASATPTLWRLLVGNLDAASARELSLRQITLGGEASPESLLVRLRELFGDVRISHVYAGTEFGSAVSVRDGRAGLPVSVLERDGDAPVHLRIVDGELQMRSRVGMLGYHASEDSADEWRATGDLVEVRGDRIHFVGRTSEIINVGGAKVHPLPIEDIACSVPGVEIAAAYGRPNPITGQIVALDLVVSAGADPDEVKAAVISACGALPAAGRPRRIKVVEELEIRGNKLLRQGT